MTAANCIAALEQGRDALDEHYRACDAAYCGKFNDLGVEARKRVNQMVWLLSEIGRYLRMGDEAQRPQKELGALLMAGQISPKEWQERMALPEMVEALRSMTQISEPLETLCESFYWIAFRARRVIQLLPEMRNFEAEGVRNTRNQLIEHSDSKDSGVVISSFAWGAEQGPVIKAIRYSDQTDTWPDKGLFPNASEFAVALINMAERAKDLIRT